MQKILISSESKKSFKTEISILEKISDLEIIMAEGRSELIEKITKSNYDKIFLKYDQLSICSYAARAIRFNSSNHDAPIVLLNEDDNIFFELSNIYTNIYHVKDQQFNSFINEFLLQKPLESSTKNSFFGATYFENFFERLLESASQHLFKDMLKLDTPYFYNPLLENLELDEVVQFAMKFLSFEGTINFAFPESSVKQMTLKNENSKKELENVCFLILSAIKNELHREGEVIDVSFPKTIDHERLMKHADERPTIIVPIEGEKIKFKVIIQFFK